MKNLVKKIGGTVDLRDVFTFGGLGLVGFGVFMIYPPAAYIVVGGVLFLIGIR